MGQVEGVRVHIAGPGKHLDVRSMERVAVLERHSEEILSRQHTTARSRRAGPFILLLLAQHGFVHNGDVSRLSQPRAAAQPCLNDIFDLWSLVLTLFGWLVGRHW
jgi:hypothetical protein